MLHAARNQETRFELLLWRHAEAEDGFPDASRRLTARGEKQALRMARWILAHAPQGLRIIVSPATRCQQTAAALGLPFETNSRLSTAYTVADLLSVVGWTENQTNTPNNRPRAALIVGHQPTLGRTAARLLSGTEAEWNIKKGALWWFSDRSQDSEAQTLLRASLPAELAG